MPDDVGIEEFMSTLNIDPEADDHEPEAAKEEPDKPEIASVADLAAKFTNSLSDMSAKQQLVFDSLLKQMDKNKAPAETAPVPAPAPDPVYVPNPTYDTLKESDPDIYAVLIAGDKDVFDRDQRLMAVINKQADQIDDLVKANNSNLGYLEESVVGAKHSDASTTVKSPEFIAWIDSQNPIVKDAYSDVLKTGTPANRIQLLDMFKEQSAADEDAAVAAAAAKGAEAEKAKLPAPGSLTDFESSKSDNTNVSLLDLASDPDRVEKYFATANGDPEQIQRLADNLAKAIEDAM